MKLSPREKIVFSAYQLQARASAAEIGAQTGLKPHVVRHAMESLKNRGAISYTPHIDIGALGYTDCCIYFNYSAAAVNVRNRLLKSLIETRRIGYFVEHAGEYQYQAAFYYKKFPEVDDFFRNVIETSGGALAERALATRITWSFFRSKFLSALPANIEELRCDARHEEILIDDLDFRILQTLSRSDGRPWSWIARELHIPGSTLEQRVKRLSDTGVIVGHLYKLSTPYSGLYKFRVVLAQRQPAADLTARLHRFSLEHPNITSFVQCVGNWDYELSIETEDPRKLPLIIEEIELGFGDDMLWRKVMTVLCHHKVCLFPF